jgi:hypothetical protein
MIAVYEHLACHNSRFDDPIRACLARSARQKSGQEAANRPAGAVGAEEEDMSQLNQFLLSHGGLVLFLAVFAEQSGLPFPAAPCLLASRCFQLGFLRRRVCHIEILIPPAFGTGGWIPGRYRFGATPDRRSGIPRLRNSQT